MSFDPGGGCIYNWRLVRVMICSFFFIMCDGKHYCLLVIFVAVYLDV